MNRKYFMGPLHAPYQSYIHIGTIKILHRHFYYLLLMPIVIVTFQILEKYCTRKKLEKINLLSIKHATLYQLL